MFGKFKVKRKIDFIFSLLVDPSDFIKFHIGRGRHVILNMNCR